MQTQHHPHPIQLLSSRFQYADRRLFFSRARLFPDRLELSGWHVGRRHEMHIALTELDHVEWDADASAATLHLREGETLRLHLPELVRWRQALEQRLSWSAPDRRPVTRTFTSSAADWSLHDLVAYTTSMG